MNCARCGRAMPAEPEAADEMFLTDEQWQVVDFMVRRYKLIEPPERPPSGLDMPEITVPAAGFLLTVDDGNLICKGCATQDELDELSLLDLRVAGAADGDELDNDDLA